MGIKIVGKIRLDENNSEKKLDAFKSKIIEIMTKNNKTTLPLGKVLHECGAVKTDVKKTFKKYNIPKEERSNDNDNFNWQRFFDENLYPEFQVECNHSWSNGTSSDALTYKPPKEDNTIGDIAVFQSNKKEEIKNNVSKASYTDKATALETAEALPFVTNEVKILKPEKKMTQEETNKLIKKLLDELNNGLYEK